MIISETCRSEVKIFCLLCGINNVTEEGKITPCPHLEGLGGMGEIIYDKNGILKKAEDKADEITGQMVEMVNTQSKHFEEEYHKIKEPTKEERDDYWKKMNTIIKECYKLVGYPQDIPVEQINGIHISTLDILKNQLNDDYFVFYTWAPMPDGSDSFYLYHLVESDVDN